MIEIGNNIPVGMLPNLFSFFGFRTIMDKKYQGEESI